jgi:SAM-dependent methyltransferase
MRPLVREFAEIVAKTLPVPEPIYEFGAFQVEGQEDLINIRGLFPGKEYCGCDMRPGLGVDKILNLHEIDVPSESVGTVLLFETIEHVEYPHKALKEVFRILKPGGLCIMTSQMFFPIHNYPYDYWRFTPYAFDSLLQQFETRFVGFAGKEDFPHTVVGIGRKGAEPFPEELQDIYEQWKHNWSINKRPKWKIAVDLVVPPLFLASTRKKLLK